MKKIETYDIFEISKLGNRSDLFGKEISDLFSSNNEKLFQIIDIGLKEHIDILPQRYEHILQGIVYYFFTNKELLQDIIQGNMGFEWQKFVDSYKSYYKFQPKQEDVKQSLYIFAQRLVGWRAKSNFKGRATSKYNEEHPILQHQKIDEEKLEKITLEMVCNYFAQELSKIIHNPKTDKPQQIDISHNIVSRYTQDTRLEKLVKLQVGGMKNSLFNFKNFINKEKGPTLIGTRFGGNTTNSKIDSFGFFENHVDLSGFPSLLMDPDFYYEHPSFKKTLSDYNKKSTNFFFGLDEKKMAAGIALFPKYTKIQGSIKELFDLKESMFPVDEVEFLIYGDTSSNVHLQKTGKRVVSDKPDGYTQLVAKIIPHKEILHLVEVCQKKLSNFYFKNTGEDNNNSIFAKNQSYTISKFGNYPYYLGKDNRTGMELVFVSLNNDIEKDISSGRFFAPIGSLGEFGFQPISNFNNEIDELYMLEIEKYVDLYATYHQIELHNNEREFIKKHIVIWLIQQPVISNNTSSVNAIIQIFQRIFKQTEKSQLVDGNQINPTYEYTISKFKKVPILSDMMKYVTKDLKLDNVITEKNIFTEINIQHLLHFNLTDDQKQKFAGYINELLKGKREYAEIDLENITFEFEKSAVITSVNTIDQPVERIVTGIWNIRIAQNNKHDQNEIELISIVKNSCRSLISDLERENNRLLNLSDDIEKQAKNYDNQQAVKDFTRIVVYNLAHIKLLHYFINQPQNHRDFKKIKSEITKYTNKHVDQKGNVQNQFGGSVDDSILFDEGYLYEKLFLDILSNKDKEHLHYSGGYTTLLRCDNYNPKFNKSSLEQSAKMQIIPSQLWNIDNEIPLPLSEVPQIGSFIQHYLSFYKKNNSLENKQLMKKNDTLMSQRLNYFLKNNQYLITFLQYTQDEGLISHEDSPILVRLSQVLHDNMSNIDGGNEYEYINKKLDDGLHAIILYQLGLIKKGEGVLQKLGKRGMQNKHYTSLLEILGTQEDLIQIKIEQLVTSGYIKKKLVNI